MSFDKLLAIGIGVYCLSRRDNKNQSTKKCSCPKSQTKKEKTWNKARKIPNCNSDNVRIDPCGNLIKWDEYGNRNSSYGWELDHIKPRANGGGNDEDNLQPLQWFENVIKSDQYPYVCRNKKK